MFSWLLSIEVECEWELILMRVGVSPGLTNK
jgi:hypothetical protein